MMVRSVFSGHGVPRCRSHEWLEVCDCRDYPPEVQRNCCCVGGSECRVTPITVCIHCDKRKDMTRALG
jgi:hypothetical protein